MKELIKHTSESDLVPTHMQNVSPDTRLTSHADIQWDI